MSLPESTAARARPAKVARCEEGWHDQSMSSRKQATPERTRRTVKAVKAVVAFARAKRGTDAPPEGEADGDETKADETKAEAAPAKPDETRAEAAPAKPDETRAEAAPAKPDEIKAEA